MKKIVLPFLPLLVLVGCSSNKDSSDVEQMPTNKPAAEADRQAAQAAVQGDPKAGVDAPRPDGK